ncbi:MAG: adenine-specific methyltransferase EcoRI family protein [Candidatus Daviesbacteria bacterium]|nr:adenine-specific methyltransferase EcoRI family protein [Candidatus Daviesbacteria bacterium]
MANKSSNKNLHKASKAKYDEFYTQLTDIEKELKHYKDQFRGKIVYCNCDDPFESNFFKYFAANFNVLGLKKLITTSFVKSPIVGGQLPLFEMEGLKPDAKEPYVVEITHVPDINKDGAISLEDVEVLLKRNKKSSRKLKGNGDFRSDECIKLLEESDIVVTNPPFSLFREYVAQLVEYKKKFLIIGNLNSITYKELFKLIKENKLWLGYNNGPKTYLVPDSHEQDNVFVGTDGKKYAQMGNTGWYTNLDISKRHELLILYKKYSSKEYKKYDNYDAIEVSKVSEIPIDYPYVMGVPVTFLDKYNPKQFEILGITDRDPNHKQRIKMYTRRDSPKYNDLNRRAAIKINGELKPVYARLLIKVKK